MTDQPEPPKCATCAYCKRRESNYLFNGAPMVAVALRCQAHPPLVDVSRAVESDDWCGEHPDFPLYIERLAAWRKQNPETQKVAE